MYKLSIIIPASGDSVRFGAENKLLFNINGRPMFETAIKNAIETAKLLWDLSIQDLSNKKQDEDGRIIIEDIIVVSKFEEIKDYCIKYNITYIQNDYSYEGISASIKIGTKAVSEESDFMFFVADQPYIKADTIKSFIEGYYESGKKLGTMLHSNGKTSNPCIFDKEFREKLLKLTGDHGGKVIIKNSGYSVYEYKVSEEKELADIDVY